MAKIIHDKLVRDLIPDIIKNKGKTCTVYVLDDSQYIEELKKKLIEESKEVQQASSKEQLIEEIADVLEVLEALRKVSEIETDEINSMKNKKAIKNGCFDNKIFLHSVSEGEVI